MILTVEPYMNVKIREIKVKTFNATYTSFTNITFILVIVEVRYWAVSKSIVGVYVEVRRLDTGAVVYSGIKSAVVSGSGCSEFAFEVSRDIGCCTGVKLECIAVGFLRFRELYDEKVDLAVTTVTKN